jgi:hypothetical protein
MASDGVPVNSPVTRLVQGSHSSVPVAVQKGIGNSLPTGGPVLPAKAAAQREADLQALIVHLNKNFNDSGKPIQFRVDPASGNKVIQAINPATGEVVGEYSAVEFPALARGLGVSGMVVDSRA